MTDQRMEVDCAPVGDGWECGVHLEDGRGSADYTVTVSGAELARYGRGMADPVPLVRGSFAFLLEREPKESIMGRFSLSVIERYFPDYPGRIGRYVEAEAP